MNARDLSGRLREWFALQMPEDVYVQVEGIESIDVGHSAEMLSLTLVVCSGAKEHHREVVVRLRPPAPGLLEPYDLQCQFDVLRALEVTEVRAPRALWTEPTGAVVGRPFFVMDRVHGEVYERQPIPPAWEAEPGRLRRMCENMVDAFAAIHMVDLDATGLRALGDGHGFLDGELDWWETEMRRVQRGRLPAMERLLEELRRQQPEPCPKVTLVHGDPKPGNVAFVGDKVSAVFDWELVDVGDPLADVGYLEIMWALPVGITSRPSSLTVEELVLRYQERTGLPVRHRRWYRAMQVFKLDVIQLIGSMLFDAGYWNDMRAVEMAMGIELMTPMALCDLGIDKRLDLGPIYPREERMREVQERAVSS